MASAFAHLANALLRPFRARIVALEAAASGASPPAVAAPAAGEADREKPWDGFFAEWIAEAERSGRDPNDIGDADWNNDPKNEALELHYLPHIGPASVVLELGPGTGRYTRHLLPRCRELILVDNSHFVCERIARFLAGKGRFCVHLIDKPMLEPVAADSVDVVVAHGVFEHIDPDETLCFLEEFRRVLKPGGVAAFDFENFMPDGGLGWFLRWKPPPGLRSPFRFYHPDMFAALARAAGLDVLGIATSRDRIGYIELRKPGAAAPER